MFREIRQSLRSLARDTSYTATVLTTLAVCIAANTAMFAIVNSVLLRPLPVPNAERIVLVRNEYPGAGVSGMGQSSGGDYYDRLKAITAFEHQAMYRQTDRTVEVDGRPERLDAMEVTPSWFDVIGQRPVLGRAFLPDEGELGSELRVVLSHGFWQQRFAGDPDVQGKELRMDGRTYIVTGVMPRGFNFVEPDVRFWVPLAFNAEQKAAHHSNNWNNIGVLKPGARVEQVQAQVDALNAANLERFPEYRQALLNAGFHSAAAPLAEVMVRSVRGSLYLLWYGAMLVLLIGGLNIANLTLARWSNRTREVASRLALGATRWQLARQLLIETLLLAAGGGVAGIAMGAGILKLLAVARLDRFPRAEEVHMDGTVVAVALGLALLVTAGLSLLPLGQTLRVKIAGALNEQGRSGTHSKRARLVRQTLVAAQVGFAFALLVGAGLLLESFRNLLAVDPGYRSEGLISASIEAVPTSYREDSDVRTLIGRTLRELRAMPGVAHVGATSGLPLSGSTSDSVMIPEGRVMAQGESVISPSMSVVTTGYFEAMKIGLVKGRYFDDRDNEKVPRVVILDEKLAEYFWPGQDPIGRRVFRPRSPSELTPGPDRAWETVVGVVRTVRQRDLSGAGERVGAYYYPHAQLPYRGLHFAVRTTTDPVGMAGSMRQALAKVDPAMPLFDIRTMTERAELSLAPRRTALLLALGFGGLALFLSAVGIYGVLSYLVASRRRELGIRMALGSTSINVARLVLGEGMGLVLAGLAMGLAGAVALRGAIEREVYGVAALDPVVLTGVAVVLAGIAVAACAGPALRAAKTDPAGVLAES